MDHYLFLARSVTHAQQMAKMLEQAGIFASIKRANAALTGKGCGYTVEVSERNFARAEAILQTSPVKPLKVIAVHGKDRVDV